MTDPENLSHLTTILTLAKRLFPDDGFGALGVGDDVNMICNLLKHIAVEERASGKSAHVGIESTQQICHE